MTVILTKKKRVPGSKMTETVRLDSILLLAVWFSALDTG